MRQRPGELQGAQKKWPQKKRFLAIFSCWMVLYGPKQCCMIREYRCAALDTPLAYIRKKIDPRPPRAQKRAKKALLGPSTEKSECRAAKPPKLRSFWHQPISGSSFRFRATEFLPVASGRFLPFPKMRFGPGTPETGPNRIFANRPP